MVLSSGKIERLCFLVLFAPAMIFLPGWLKPVFSVPLTLMALAGASLQINSKTWKSTAHDVPVARCAVILLLCAAWLFLAGTGGIGFQNSDHEKHNAVLYDLVDHSYPVVYPEQKHLDAPSNSPLVYYLGYYLLPAFAGKLFHSYRLSQWLLFFQLFFAAILVMAWIVVRFRLNRFYWAGLLLFMLFSGADIWNHLLLSKSMPPVGTHLEWPPYLLTQYSATTTQLFWVPQHATAAWLGAIVILGALRDSDAGRCFAAVCLLGLWSPFVAVGCIPFCLLFLGKGCLGAFGHKRAEIMRTAGVILCFLPPAVVVCLFLHSRSESVVASRVLVTWGGYFRTILFEFGWWLPLLCLRFAHLDPLEKRLLLAALATLAVLPVVKAPGILDFIMRASMPSLFVLFLSVLSAVREARIGSRSQAALAAVTAFFLVSSWVTPLYEMARSAQHYGIKVPSFEGGDRVVLLEPRWTTRQYIGNAQSFFFRRLARRQNPGNPL